MRDATRNAVLSTNRCPRLLVALCCLVAFITGCSDTLQPVAVPRQVKKVVQAPKASDPPREVLGATLCLTTETYPSNGRFEDRLLREIVRQGVLIVGREELGMLTRDQTLGEPFPESQASGDVSGDDSDEEMVETRPIRALSLATRFSPGTKAAESDAETGWQATLMVDEAPSLLPIWQSKGKADADPRTRYPQLVAEVTALMPAITKQLEAAGASDTSAQPNAENLPPAKIETLLNEMNFVSQYAAARAAHQAIRKAGASEAWLGVLVRAYAHLSVLTTHTWSSHGEAFAARSLLYAERMLTLSDDKESSRWHRAYAYATLGLHTLAIEEYEMLTEATPDAKLPAWAELIQPVATYNHDAVAQVGQRHPELQQTAAYHQWNLYYSYLHGRWVYEKGLTVMEACPEAYGVYSALANWPALRIKRIGSGAGMGAFGEALPRRVAKIDSLPESIKPLVTTPAEWINQLGNLFGQGSSAYLGTRPIQVARALDTESLSDVGELSWAVLGQLIAEEQFTQVADLLHVDRDGVEHSKDNLMERVRPLVEEHRFASYIESCSFAYHQKREINQELIKLSIKDPRGSMSNMLSRTSSIILSDGLCGGELAVRSAENRTLMLPTLLSAYNRVVLNWSKSYPSADAKLVPKHFAIVSPYSPQSQRNKFEVDHELSVEEIKKIEATLTDDPIAWIVAAEHYKELESTEDAIRCYRRSLEISPCLLATQSLASLYYGKGDKEEWTATLKGYLDEEDLSLTHAQIHHQLANEQLATRNWEAAKPHAIEAANTYSAWGLVLAGRVCEGLQDWKASEQYFSEASKNYPSGNTGTEWYFWCHRTGRGDLDTARSIAAKSIAIAEQRNFYDSQLRVALFRWLDGDLQGALSQAEGPLQDVSDSAEPWTRIYNTLIAAAIAVELEDEVAINRCATQVRTLLETDTIKQYPNWIVMFNGLCDALSGKEPPEEFYAAYDKSLAETTDTYRCDYSYFMGVALERIGKRAMADKYYAVPAFQVTQNRYTATLASRRLVAHHGPDRNGLPETYAKIEAANEQANQDKAAEEDSATEPQDEPPASESDESTSQELAKDKTA